MSTTPPPAGTVTPPPQGTHEGAAAAKHRRRLRVPSILELRTKGNVFGPQAPKRKSVAPTGAFALAFASPRAVPSPTRATDDGVPHDDDDNDARDPSDAISSSVALKRDGAAKPRFGDGTFTEGGRRFRTTAAKQNLHREGRGLSSPSGPTRHLIPVPPGEALLDTPEIESVVVRPKMVGFAARRWKVLLQATSGATQNFSTWRQWAALLEDARKKRPRNRDLKREQKEREELEAVRARQDKLMAILNFATPLPATTAPSAGIAVPAVAAADVSVSKSKEHGEGGKVGKDGAPGASTGSGLNASVGESSEGGSNKDALKTTVSPLKGIESDETQQALETLLDDERGDLKNAAVGGSSDASVAGKYTEAKPFTVTFATQPEKKKKPKKVNRSTIEEEEADLTTPTAGADSSPVNSPDVLAGASDGPEGPAAPTALQALLGHEHKTGPKRDLKRMWQLCVALLVDEGNSLGTKPLIPIERLNQFQKIFVRDPAPVVEKYESIMSFFGPRARRRTVHIERIKVKRDTADRRRKSSALHPSSSSPRGQRKSTLRGPPDTGEQANQRPLDKSGRTGHDKAKLDERDTTKPRDLPSTKTDHKHAVSRDEAPHQQHSVHKSHQDRRRSDRSHTDTTKSSSELSDYDASSGSSSSVGGEGPLNSSIRHKVRYYRRRDKHAAKDAFRRRVSQLALEAKTARRISSSMLSSGSGSTLTSPLVQSISGHKKSVAFAGSADSPTKSAGTSGHQSVAFASPVSPMKSADASNHHHPMSSSQKSGVNHWSPGDAPALSPRGVAFTQSPNASLVESSSVAVATAVAVDAGADEKPSSSSPPPCIPPVLTAHLERAAAAGHDESGAAASVSVLKTTAGNSSIGSTAEGTAGAEGTSVGSTSVASAQQNSHSVSKKSVGVTAPCDGQSSPRRVAFEEPPGASGSPRRDLSPSRNRSVASLSPRRVTSVGAGEGKQGAGNRASPVRSKSLFAVPSLTMAGGEASPRQRQKTLNASDGANDRSASLNTTARQRQSQAFRSPSVANFNISISASKTSARSMYDAPDALLSKRRAMELKKAEDERKTKEEEFKREGLVPPALAAAAEIAMTFGSPAGPGRGGGSGIHSPLSPVLDAMSRSTSGCLSPAGSGSINASPRKQSSPTRPRRKSSKKSSARRSKAATNDDLGRYMFGRKLSDSAAASVTSASPRAVRIVGDPYEAERLKAEADAEADAENGDDEFASDDESDSSEDNELIDEPALLRPLNEVEFVAAFLDALGSVQGHTDHEVRQWFRHIDVYGSGTVTWDSFSSFMFFMASNYGTGNNRARELVLDERATVGFSPEYHRDGIKKLLCPFMGAGGGPEAAAVVAAAAFGAASPVQARASASPASFFAATAAAATEQYAGFACPYIVSGGLDGMVKLWDPVTMKPVKSASVSARAVAGQVSGSSGVAQGVVPRKAAFGKAPQPRVLDMVYSAKGDLIMACGGDKTITCFDARTLEVKRRYVGRWLIDEDEVVAASATAAALGQTEGRASDGTTGQHLSGSGFHAPDATARGHGVSLRAERDAFRRRAHEMGRETAEEREIREKNEIRGQQMIERELRSNKPATTFYPDGEKAKARDEETERDRDPWDDDDPNRPRRHARRGTRDNEDDGGAAAAAQALLGGQPFALPGVGNTTTLFGVADSPVTMDVAAPRGKEALFVGCQDGRILSYPTTRKGLSAKVHPFFSVAAHDGPLTKLRYYRTLDSLVTSSWDKTLAVTSAETGQVTTRLDGGAFLAAIAPAATGAGARDFQNSADLSAFEQTDATAMTAATPALSSPTDASASPSRPQRVFAGAVLTGPGATANGDDEDHNEGRRLDAEDARIRARERRSLTAEDGRDDDVNENDDDAAGSPRKRFASSGLTLSPSGQQLSAASSPRTLADLSTKDRVVNAVSPSGAIIGITQPSAKVQQMRAQNAVAAFQTGAGLQRHNKMSVDFDFNPIMRLLASVACEREVLLWSPSVASPLARLAGHTTVLQSVTFDVTDKQLFSLDCDDNILVWDLRMYRVSQSISGSQVHEGFTRIHSLKYDDFSSQLLAGSHRLSSWTVRRAFSPFPAKHSGHTEPIVNVALAGDGCSLITCDSSVVMTWDIRSGKRNIVFDPAKADGGEFGAGKDTHSDVLGGGLSCLGLDTTGRRLLVSAMNGQGQIVNFRNGQKMRELDPPNAPPRKDVQLSYLDATKSQDSAARTNAAAAAEHQIETSGPGTLTSVVQTSSIAKLKANSGPPKQVVRPVRVVTVSSASAVDGRTNAKGKSKKAPPTGVLKSSGGASNAPKATAKASAKLGSTGVLTRPQHGASSPAPKANPKQSSALLKGSAAAPVSTVDPSASSKSSKAVKKDATLDSVDEAAQAISAEKAAEPIKVVHLSSKDETCKYFAVVSAGYACLYDEVSSSTGGVATPDPVVKVLLPLAAGVITTATSMPSIGPRSTCAGLVLATSAGHIWTFFAGQDALQGPTVHPKRPTTRQQQRRREMIGSRGSSRGGSRGGSRGNAPSPAAANGGINLPDIHARRGGAANNGVQGHGENSSGVRGESRSASRGGVGFLLNADGGAMLSREGRRAQKTAAKSRPPVESIVHLPRRDVVLTVCGDSSVYVWDLRHNRLLTTLSTRMAPEDCLVAVTADVGIGVDGHAHAAAAAGHVAAEHQDPTPATVNALRAAARRRSSVHQASNMPQQERKDNRQGGQQDEDAPRFNARRRSSSFGGIDRRKTQLPLSGSGQGTSPSAPTGPGPADSTTDGLAFRRNSMFGASTTSSTRGGPQRASTMSPPRRRSTQVTKRMSEGGAGQDGEVEKDAGSDVSVGAELSAEQEIDEMVKQDLAQQKLAASLVVEHAQNAPISAHEEFLITGDDNGVVAIRDLRPMPGRLSANPGEFEALTFLPLLRVIQAHFMPISKLLYSSSLGVIISFSNDMHVKIHRAVTGSFIGYCGQRALWDVDRAESYGREQVAHGEPSDAPPMPVPIPPSAPAQDLFQSGDFRSVGTPAGAARSPQSLSFGAGPSGRMGTPSGSLLRRTSGGQQGGAGRKDGQQGKRKSSGDGAASATFLTESPSRGKKRSGDDGFTQVSIRPDDSVLPPGQSTTTPTSLKTPKVTPLPSVAGAAERTTKKNGNGGKETASEAGAPATMRVDPTVPLSMKYTEAVQQLQTKSADVEVLASPKNETASYSSPGPLYGARHQDATANSTGCGLRSLLDVVLTPMDKTQQMMAAPLGPANAGNPVGKRNRPKPKAPETTTGQMDQVRSSSVSRSNGGANQRSSRGNTDLASSSSKPPKAVPASTSLQSSVATAPGRPPKSPGASTSVLKGSRGTHPSSRGESPQKSQLGNTTLTAPQGSSGSPSGSFRTGKGSAATSSLSPRAVGAFSTQTPASATPLSAPAIYAVNTERVAEQAKEREARRKQNMVTLTAPAVEGQIASSSVHPTAHPSHSTEKTASDKLLDSTGLATQNVSKVSVSPRAGSPTKSPKRHEPKATLQEVLATAAVQRREKQAVQDQRQAYGETFFTVQVSPRMPSGIAVSPMMTGKINASALDTELLSAVSPMPPQPLPQPSDDNHQSHSSNAAGGTTDTDKDNGKDKASLQAPLEISPSYLSPAEGKGRGRIARQSESQPGNGPLPPAMIPSPTDVNAADDQDVHARARWEAGTQQHLAPALSIPSITKKDSDPTSLSQPLTEPQLHSKARHGAASNDSEMKARSEERRKGTEGGPLDVDNVSSASSSTASSAPLVSRVQRDSSSKQEAGQEGASGGSGSGGGGMSQATLKASGASAGFDASMLEQMMRTKLGGEFKKQPSPREARDIARKSPRDATAARTKVTAKNPKSAMAIQAAAAARAKRMRLRRERADVQLAEKAAAQGDGHLSSGGEEGTLSHSKHSRTLHSPPLSPTMSPTSPGGNRGFPGGGGAGSPQHGGVPFSTSHSHGHGGGSSQTTAGGGVGNVLNMFRDAQTRIIPGRTAKKGQAGPVSPMRSNAGGNGTDTTDGTPNVDSSAVESGGPQGLSDKAVLAIDAAIALRRGNKGGGAGGGAGGAGSSAFAVGAASAVTENVSTLTGQRVLRHVLQAGVPGVTKPNAGNSSATPNGSLTSASPSQSNRSRSGAVEVGQDKKPNRQHRRRVDAMVTVRSPTAGDAAMLSPREMSETLRESITSRSTETASLRTTSPGASTSGLLTPSQGFISPAHGQSSHGSTANRIHDANGSTASAPHRSERTSRQRDGSVFDDDTLAEVESDAQAAMKKLSELRAKTLAGDDGAANEKVRRGTGRGTGGGESGSVLFAAGPRSSLLLPTGNAADFMPSSVGGFVRGSRKQRMSVVADGETSHPSSAPSDHTHAPQDSSSLPQRQTHQQEEKEQKRQGEARSATPSKRGSHSGLTPDADSGGFGAALGSLAVDPSLWSTRVASLQRLAPVGSFAPPPQPQLSQGKATPARGAKGGAKKTAMRPGLASLSGTLDRALEGTLGTASLSGTLGGTLGGTTKSREGKGHGAKSGATPKGKGKGSGYAQGSLSPL